MGWRTKLVFLLIVYCAGFATAVYCLAPAPEPKPGESRQTAHLGSALKPHQWLTSFNSGMHKCVAFSKEAAAEAAKLLQAKIDEINKVPSNG